MNEVQISVPADLSGFRQQCDYLMAALAKTPFPAEEGLALECAFAAAELEPLWRRPGIIDLKVVLIVADAAADSADLAAAEAYLAECRSRLTEALARVVFVAPDGQEIVREPRQRADGSSVFEFIPYGARCSVRARESVALGVSSDRAVENTLEKGISANESPTEPSQGSGEARPQKVVAVDFSRKPVELTTSSVARFSGWPLRIAAAVAVLAGVAAFLFFRNEPDDSGGSVVQQPSGQASRGPFYASVETALERKPLASGGKGVLMGDENQVTKRSYEGQFESLEYFDRSTKKLPFIRLPVVFQKKEATVELETAGLVLPSVAEFLKSPGAAAMKVIVEVHSIRATLTETDAPLARQRAEYLQAQLEAQGVPHDRFGPSQGFGTETSKLPPSLKAVAGGADAVALIVREE